MTDSSEAGTRAWTLQQLRQMADSQIVQDATQQKVHDAMGPGGAPVMAYCRDEGLEIIADRSGGDLIVQANEEPITSLIERAASGDQSAEDDLCAKFTPPQLDAIHGVLQAMNPRPPRSSRRRFRWNRQ